MREKHFTVVRRESNREFLLKNILLKEFFVQGALHLRMPEGPQDRSSKSEGLILKQSHLKVALYAVKHSTAGVKPSISLGPV